KPGTPLARWLRGDRGESGMPGNDLAASRRTTLRRRGATMRLEDCVDLPGWSTGGPDPGRASPRPPLDARFTCVHTVGQGDNDTWGGTRMPDIQETQVGDIDISQLPEDRTPHSATGQPRALPRLGTCWNRGWCR